MAPRGGLREVDQAQLSKHPVGILAQRSGVFCNWSISFHIVRSPLSLVLRHAVLCWLDGTVFTDHFVNVSSAPVGLRSSEDVNHQALMRCVAFALWGTYAGR